MAISEFVIPDRTIKRIKISTGESDNQNMGKYVKARHEYVALYAGQNHHANDKLITKRQLLPT
jgi:hypothetical protein